MCELRLAKYWWTLGALMVLVVSVLSLMHFGPPRISMPNNFDKIQHLLVYAALSGYFAQLLVSRRFLLCMTCALLAFSGLLEIAQGLTGYRSADWRDLLANGIGILLGTLLSIKLFAAQLQRWEGAFFAQNRTH